LQRLALFAYGVVAYLVFLATFLYAIAFVGGFAVPTTLDGTPRGPFVRKKREARRSRDAFSRAVRR
jgi:hypothetical protein